MVAYATIFLIWMDLVFLSTNCNYDIFHFLNRLIFHDVFVFFYNILYPFSSHATKIVTLYLHKVCMVFTSYTYNDTPPHSLKDLNTSPKVKTKEEGVGVRSLTRSILGLEGRVGALR